MNNLFINIYIKFYYYNQNIYFLRLHADITPTPVPKEPPPIRQPAINPI